MLFLTSGSVSRCSQVWNTLPLVCLFSHPDLHLTISCSSFRSQLRPSKHWENLPHVCVPCLPLCVRGIPPFLIITFLTRIMTVEWVGVITDHSHPRAGDFPDTGSLLWLLPSIPQQSYFLFRRTSECSELLKRGGRGLRDAQRLDSVQ